MITAGSRTFDDEEEAISFFEEKLFEVKQHLQQKPLLRATVRSRISQLTQLSVLEEQLPISRSEYTLAFPDFSGKTIYEQWNFYAALFSKWKLFIFQTESAKDILELIELGFDFMKQFYSLIPDLELEEDVPKVGVAENIMHLQAGFEWVKAEGISSFSDLEERIVDRIGENETVKLFAMELKRLSLRVSYL